jgi:hypothetical protein
VLNLIAAIDHATSGQVAVGAEQITMLKESELTSTRRFPSDTYLTFSAGFMQLVNEELIVIHNKLYFKNSAVSRGKSIWLTPFATLGCVWSAVRIGSPRPTYTSLIAHFSDDPGVWLENIPISWYDHAD